MDKPYYVTVLIAALEGKKKINPRYSLRSFAHYLEIDSSSLSSVLKVKRALPIGRVLDIIAKLGLDDEKKKLFINSVETEHTRLHKISGSNLSKTTLQVDNDAQMRIMLGWEYLAIYALLATADEPKPIKWISERLDIEEEIVLECINDLLGEKLLEQIKDGYRKVGQWVHIRKSDEFEVAVEAQKESAKLFLDKCEKNELLNGENSYLTSITLSADPEKMEGAKKIIDEFKTKLSTYMRQSKTSEVYQMNIQMFPLTKISK
jgi:uncharacterized protein (TIGR02147 family)